MIVVSVTSWKGRISTLGKCLYYFLSRQTVKPDKLYLTLSLQEFPKGRYGLPNDLNIVIDFFNIELNWMDTNIYSHKKYEVFKKYNDCYVIIIDDDIFYPQDHIEKLIETSKLYNDASVCCYYGKTIDYTNGRRIEAEFNKKPNLKNALYSGLACFPPKSFPAESFNFEKERSVSSPVCDDSWVNAWLLKHNIKVAFYKNWASNNIIDISDTQNVSIWKNHNSKNVNGTIQKYVNMCNVLKILHIDISNIWPNMQVDKYATI